ncbi:MAG: magnesium transporter [Bacilli bacterium]
MSDNNNNVVFDEEKASLQAVKEEVSNIEANETEEILTVNEEILPELLHKALIINDKSQIIQLADDNSDVSLAEALNDLTNNEVNIFFSMVNDFNVLGNIFSYLSVEERVYLTENLPRKTIVLVLDAVVDDDLADFVEDLTKSLREKVINYLSPKRRKIINELARYSDDTIGSIMTTEYLTVRSGTIIKDIFATIKKIGKTLETVRIFFIVDNKGNNVLLGTESLEDLMFEDVNQVIDEVMSTDYPFISPIADKEEAIPICRKFDLPVLPVVSKNGEILGIITFDDVMDVIEEENTEDVYKSGAVSPTDKPYLETKAYRMALSYVVWLIILLVINTFTSVIISNFETALLTLPVLISFLPMLNDTGGNSGDQTTSTVTRALSTGEITVKDYWKVASREIMAGFLTALIVCCFNFGWTIAELNLHLVNTDANTIISAFGSLQKGYVIISMVVSVAIFFAVFVSKILGANLPMLAKLCHIDPAIMSGPLIASLMDILTLLIYFTISMLVIDAFNPGLIEITSNMVMPVLGI